MLESEDPSFTNENFLIRFFNGADLHFKARRREDFENNWQFQESHRKYLKDEWASLEISDFDLKIEINKKGICVKGSESYEITSKDLEKSIFANHVIRLAKSINGKNETYIFFNTSEIINTLETNKHQTALSLFEFFSCLRKVKSIWFSKPS
tara:strand:- start:977 stop:1432 length:456 start_codon:yes stop_codon:yes gene_type:complete